MTIVRHTCYADGSSQLGSYMDCPKCWGALEQSVELARSEGTFEEERPHLIVENSAKTVDLGQAEEVSRENSPEDEGEDCVLDHATSADTYPDPEAAGGVWKVSCVCGWSKSGHYARDGGEAVALNLAHLWGDRHEKDPRE